MNTSVTTPTELTGTEAPALVDHDLAAFPACPLVSYEKRPATTPEGETAEGLWNAWITLNNPKQYNSYTTQAVKEIILAFREA